MQQRAASTSFLQVTPAQLDPALLESYTLSMPQKAAAVAFTDAQTAGDAQHSAWWLFIRLLHVNPTPSHPQILSALALLYTVPEGQNVAAVLCIDEHVALGVQHVPTSLSFLQITPAHVFRALPYALSSGQNSLLGGADRRLRRASHTARADGRALGRVADRWPEVVGAAQAEPADVSSDHATGRIKPVGVRAHEVDL